MTRDELIERLKALIAEIEAETGNDGLLFAGSVLCTLAASLLDKTDNVLAHKTAEHSKAQLRTHKARWN